MVAKPKTASWWSRNKTIVLVTLIGMGLVVVALFAFYQSQRPNYRDLEREYQSLNIPTYWKLESQSSNKGFLGMFCLQIAGEQCPYITNEYSFASSSELLDSLNHFDNYDFIQEGDCDKLVDCKLSTFNDGVKIVLIPRNQDAYGKSGSYLIVAVAAKE